jgi:hypothetical protein
MDIISAAAAVVCWLGQDSPLALPWHCVPRSSGSDNQGRFGCFADWLVSEFGEELLRNKHEVCVIKQRRNVALWLVMDSPRGP